MGFRFWRRVRIAPGESVNFSKSGASLSVGASQRQNEIRTIRDANDLGVVWNRVILLV